MSNPLLMYPTVTNPYEYVSASRESGFKKHPGDIDDWEKSDFETSSTSKGEISQWDKFTNKSFNELLENINKLASGELSNVAGNFSGIQQHNSTSMYRMPEDFYQIGQPVRDVYVSENPAGVESWFSGVEKTSSDARPYGWLGNLSIEAYKNILGYANTLSTKNSDLINVYSYYNEKGEEFDVVIPDLRKGTNFGNREATHDQYVISSPYSFSNFRSNILAYAKSFDIINNSDHFKSQKPKTFWLHGYLASHGSLGLPGITQSQAENSSITYEGARSWREAMFRRNGENIISTRYFYPVGDGFNEDDEKNTITTGAGSDYVIYDNTQSTISLGDGDDLAFPAIKAFSPSVNIGHHAQQYLISDKTQVRYSDDCESFGASCDTKYVDASYPYVNANSEGKLNFSSNRLLPQQDTATLGAATIENPFVNNPIESKNSGVVGQNDKVWYYTKKTQILASKPNRQSVAIGGQRIYGGSGNDTLHGFNPLIYPSEKAHEINYYTEGLKNPGAWPGEQRHPTEENILNNINLFTEKNIDFKWTPILLSGGKGSDRINLGDLKRMNGDIVNKDLADTLYLVFGDKESIEDCELGERIDKKWADNLSSDTYSLDASYDFKEEIIVEGLNIDTRKPGDKGGTDWAANAATLQKGVSAATATIAATFGTKFPITAAASAMVGLGIDLYKEFQNSQSDESKNEAASFYNQEEVKKKIVPFPSWTKAVTISDFDPGDNITINLIPIEDPSVDQSDDKWSNVNFTMTYEGDKVLRPNGYGHVVKLKTSDDPQPNPLVYLSGLTSPNQASTYGWKSWDFTIGQERTLDPIQDMAWFGVLSNTEKTQEMKEEYTESKWSNLTITKDSPYSDIFRWDSSSLGDKGILDNYRSGSSSMRLMFDNLKLGWYWDTRFIKDGDDAGNVDQDSSFLHYYDKNKKAWTQISYRDLNDNPEDKDQYGVTYQDIAQKAQFEYWTVNDDHIVTLKNESLSESGNSNQLLFYAVDDNGFVQDPATGEMISPGDPRYQNIALNADSLTGLKVVTSETGVQSYQVDGPGKIAPVLKSVEGDGQTNYWFAFKDANPDGEKVFTQLDIDTYGFEDAPSFDQDFNDFVFSGNSNNAILQHVASAVWENA